jgi:hypothetical protein
MIAPIAQNWVMGNKYRAMGNKHYYHRTFHRRSSHFRAHESNSDSSVRLGLRIAGLFLG